MKVPPNRYLVVRGTEIFWFLTMDEAMWDAAANGKVYEITHRLHTSRCSGETEILPRARRLT